MGDAKTPGHIEFLSGFAIGGERGCCTECDSGSDGFYGEGIFHKLDLGVIEVGFVNRVALGANICICGFRQFDLRFCPFGIWLIRCNNFGWYNLFGSDFIVLYKSVIIVWYKPVVKWHIYIVIFGCNVVVRCNYTVRCNVVVHWID